ncbi:MAG: hypothetical protein ACK5O7_07040 [Holosporales bacterium]
MLKDFYIIPSRKRVNINRATCILLYSSLPLYGLICSNKTFFEQHWPILIIFGFALGGLLEFLDKRVDGIELDLGNLILMKSKRKLDNRHKELREKIVNYGLITSITCLIILGIISFNRYDIYSIRRIACLIMFFIAFLPLLIFHVYYDLPLTAFPLSDKKKRKKVFTNERLIFAATILSLPSATFWEKIISLTKEGAIDFLIWLGTWVG